MFANVKSFVINHKLDIVATATLVACAAVTYKLAVMAGDTVEAYTTEEA